MWNGRGREKSKVTAFGPSFLVNGSFFSLRWEAVCWVRGRGLCCLAMINLRCLLQPQVDNRGEGQDINLVIIGVLLEHSIGRNNFSN